jgi:hypothetical protein
VHTIVGLSLEGFKGKRCDKFDFCLNTVCPDDSCTDLADGFECVINVTFAGAASPSYLNPIYVFKIFL